MSGATWWLSFAAEQPLGVVLVDYLPGSTDTFLSARVAMTLAGVESPGGECVGLCVTREDVPEAYRQAFALLPRLTLLHTDDLRMLGPLVNLSGEPR